MSKPQHKSSKTGTSTLTQLIRNFVGNDGAFCSYSLVEGSLDAEHEDLYQITFHEKAGLITFYRGWSFDESIIPVSSPRFIKILHFLKDTDDQLNASTLQALIGGLECRKHRFRNASPINEITVGHRRAA
jgi:hypothetical protein